jgi:hypothetical protein
MIFERFGDQLPLVGVVFDDQEPQLLDDGWWFHDKVHIGAFARKVNSRLDLRPG